MFGDGARNLGNGTGPVADGLHEADNRPLALATQDTINGAGAMLKEIIRDKGRAVAADDYVATRRASLDGLGEVNDFGNVCKVIAREGDDIRLPVVDHAEAIVGRFDLQVDQADVMSRSARGRRHQFQTKRFQSQEDLGVHEGARMDGKQTHCVLLFWDTFWPAKAPDQ